MLKQKDQNWNENPEIITIVERECGGIFGGISFFYQIIWDIGSIEGERDVFAQPFIFLPPIQKPLKVAKMLKLFKYYNFHIIFAAHRL